MELVNWIWNHRDEILIAVGSIGVAAEGGALALLSLARLLSGLAKLTGTDADDRALARIISALESFAAWIPRLRRGAGAPPIDPRGSAALGLVLAIGVALSGCGASAMDIARDTTAGGALALVAVDPVIADRYDALTLDCDSGAIDADTCTDRLRRLDRAERAIRSLASALTAVDLALGAYEDGRECGLRPALEGAARSARELVAALDAAGIDVPPLVLAVANIAVTVADVPDCEVSAEDVETARAIVSGGWL